MDKNEKIVVTGGTGFIGSYILRELIDNGFTNIHAIRGESSDMRLVADFQNRISWHVARLEDIDDIYRIIQGAGNVIHAAGLVSFSPSDKDRLYEINVRGTETIVNACLEHQVRRLIHISSVAAIAKTTNGRPITEQTKWHDDRHTSHYGRSKHGAEIEVWRGIAEGLDAIILNPSIVLGAGDWYSSSCQLFMQIYHGLKFYTPGSTGFVDVRDVAAITVGMLDVAMVNEAYILNESNYHFEEIFGLMARGLDKKPPSILAPRWIARLIVAWEYVKSKMTGRHPVITRDSVRNSYECFNYDNQKIRSLGFSFTPVGETIRDTTKLLKQAAAHDFEPMLLKPGPITKSNQWV